MCCKRILRVLCLLKSKPIPPGRTENKDLYSKSGSQKSAVPIDLRICYLKVIFGIFIKKSLSARFSLIVLPHRIYGALYSMYIIDHTYRSSLRKVRKTVWIMSHLLRIKKPRLQNTLLVCCRRRKVRTGTYCLFYTGGKAPVGIADTTPL